MRIDKANQRFLDYQNAKVGDVNGRELLVQITNNGVVEDQTGTTLKLNWQHENGNQGSTNFNTVDIKTGKYSLYYPKEMLYKGTVDASIEINSNGQTTNTMNFKIIVHADVFNGEAGTVNGVFISLADVNKKLDDREKEYIDLKKRQTSVETQFNSVQQELTDKDIISSPEIIAARNGKNNLKQRLDYEHQEVSTYLEHITTVPSETMFKSDITIEEGLPEITLEDVKSVDNSATLSDSADWFVLQSYIDECARTKTRSIRIPEGTYYMSRGLDLSGLEYDSHVNAHGVKLQFVNQSDYAVLLEHRGNYWKGRRVNIEGLEIRGEYMCKVGVSVQGVQEWVLSNVRIHACHIGILMADTWYGDVNTMTIIENCLIGIDFGYRNTNEINTIGFNNIKLNASNTLEQKQRFIPKNTGESDEDYDERVSFIGVRLGGVIGGINFFKVTIEGHDYAYKYESKSRGSSGGVETGVFSIENNYLESIKKAFFDFRIPRDSNRVEYLYNLDIKGTRVHGTPKYPSYFTDGFYHITQNQSFDVIFRFVGRSRLMATIDESVNLVDVIGMAYITKTRNDMMANPQKFGLYGDRKKYPTSKTALPSIQDDEFKITPTFEGMTATSGGPYVKNHNILSVTTVPVTFARSFGNKNGPVIQSDDGRFHMLQVSNDGTLYTERIVNLNRLNYTLFAKTGKELYETIDDYELNDIVSCIDINEEVTLELVEGAKKWVVAGAVAIGTSEELLKNPNTARRWFDVSTHQVVRMDGESVYRFVDWYGRATTTRAYSTLSQRPTNPPNDFIYYATDEKKYYKFTDGEYSEIQPNV